MSNEEKVVGYPFGIDVRVALLESAVDNINQTLLRIETQLSDIRRDAKSDFRWLLSMIIGSTVGITAIMAHGFHWF